jgi:hypothetical protein
MALSQRERDRIRVLHEVQQGHVTQVEGARRLKLSDRQVRRLLLRIAKHGDRAVRQPGYGDVRLLEYHVQPAQHRLGAGHIIRQESGQALALLYIRLKGQDVHATFRQSEHSPRAPGLSSIVTVNS